MQKKCKIQCDHSEKLYILNKTFEKSLTFCITAIIKSSVTKKKRYFDKNDLKS